jgi:type VI secretion system protein ImpJ
MSGHVHWHEGLFLQPHHLQLMQLGLREDLRAERRLAWHYPYGVVECSLLRDQLDAGRIVFEKLRVIMRSGLEVNYPENAELPVLDIQAELARSTGAFNVCLGVPEWKPNGANAFQPGQATDSKAKILYGIKELSRPDENTGENAKPLRVRMVNARLMLENENQLQMEVLPLLRIQRAADRTKDWSRLDPNFVPPCLVLSGSTILQRIATELAAKVERSRNELGQKLARGALNLEGRLAKTLKLRTFARFAGSLSALAAAPNTTPFEIYLVWRELLGELAAIKPSLDNFNCATYDHDNPYPCLEDLCQRIERLIPDEEDKYLQVSFNKNAKGNPQAVLTAEHLTRPLAYHLGVQTRMPHSDLANYLKQRRQFQVLPGSLEGFAIDGIELKEGDVPGALPGAQLGEAQLHYFRLLLKESDYWPAFQEDKSVVLIWKTAEFNLDDAVFTLYMPVAG